MKIRTIYFKVSNLQRALDFWSQFLEIEPHKNSDQWCEFLIQDLRLGLLLNDFDDKFSGSNCVPVFEFNDDEVMKYIEKAKTLGAQVIVHGLENENMKSVLFKDPEGNEFEVSKFHE